MWGFCLQKRTTPLTNNSHVKKESKMAKKDYDAMSVQLLQDIGGGDNISQVYHCITRLRFSVKDQNKVSVDKIAKIPGTNGAQYVGSELQVFIGPDVKKAYDALMKRYEPTEPGEVGPKKSVLDRITGFFAAIFLPILPALVGGGMVKSITVLLQTVGWLSPESDWSAMLNIVGDATFWFLPFLLALTSARFFNVNQVLALVLAGTLMYPTVMNGLGEGVTSLHLLGIGVPLQSYANSVIPIILSVYLMKWVYKGMEKVIPDIVQIVFVPTLTLLITVPLALAFLAPLGSYVAGGLAMGVTWLFEVSGFIASALVGALIPVIVMFGMHTALQPLMLQNVQSIGYDYMLPLFFFQTLAMSGAAFAVFFRTRNVDLRGSAASTGLAAFLGITEPAMYGVNLPLKKPFIAALIGSGTAGAVGYLMGVKAYAFALPSVLSIPTYMNPEQGSTLGGVLIAAVTAFAVAFVITLLWWKGTSIGASEAEDAGIAPGTAEPLVIYSPILEGTTVAVTGVADPSFARELLGPSLAFSPANGMIVAPTSGTVTLVADTGHAVGIKAEDGTEVLLHVGIDTVKLGGTPFDVKVKVGDHVDTGQILMETDLNYLQTENVDSTVILALTNTKPGFKQDLVAPGTDVSPSTAVAKVATPSRADARN